MYSLLYITNMTDKAVFIKVPWAIVLLINGIFYTPYWLQYQVTYNCMNIKGTKKGTTLTFSPQIYTSGQQYKAWVMIYNNIRLIHAFKYRMLLSAPPTDIIEQTISYFGDCLSFDLGYQFPLFTFAHFVALSLLGTK